MVINTEIFFAFFWALMAADVVALFLGAGAFVAWKFWRRRKAHRRWRGQP